MSLCELFKRIGFSDKEAKLYLACLEIGDGTVVQLSRKSGVTRGSTYDLLEDMLNKGYVSKVEKDKHMVFSAVNPETLKKRYVENVRDFEAALPDLKALCKNHSDQKVYHFEGSDGIRRVLEETLTSVGEILHFSGPESINQHWADFDRTYAQLRIQKQIFLKKLAPDDERGLALKKSDRSCLRETRLVTLSDHAFRDDIFVFDNKVAIVSSGAEPMGILIESQSIASTHRCVFRSLWSSADSKIEMPIVTLKKIIAPRSPKAYDQPSLL